MAKDLRKDISVFIVEDERIIAEDIRLTLLNKAYSVLGIAESGKKAYQGVIATRPDVVLMDIVLKGELNGIETASKILRDYDTAIIYCTAYSDNKIVEGAQNTRPYGYILKPFDERDLCRTIDMAASLFKLRSQLKKSEEKYRFLVESLNLGVFIFQNGHVVFANKMFDKMISLSENDIQSLRFKDFYKLILRDDRRIFLNFIKFWRNGLKTSASVTCRAFFPRQRERWAKIIFNPVEYLGKPGINVSVSDVTEEKRNENQLFHAKKMETIGHVAAGVAHQLNTPLSVISSRLQMLQDEMEENEHSEYLDNIQKIISSGDKMSEIIKNFLSVAHYSRGKKEKISVNDLILEIVQFLGELCKKSSLEIVTELSADIPVMLIEKNKMEQAFINIAMNAIDATTAGSTLRIRTIKIKKKSVHFVVIEFIDNGSGMSKQTLANLFTPFYTTKPSGKGTGLGMFLSYNIINEHNGEIAVDTFPGEGTTIKIILPIT